MAKGLKFPVTPSPPARWIASLRGIEWRPSLRWFVAEFFVVVAGILTALALQSWWEGKNDRSNEQIYLRQLGDDIHQTERIIRDINYSAAEADRSGAMLVQSYRNAEQPPADSVFYWMNKSAMYFTARPVIGTAETLVATGDIRLIRDNQLRLLTVAYLEQNRHLIQSQYDILQQWWEGYQTASSRIDFIESMTHNIPASQVDSLRNVYDLSALPTGSLRTPFPIDIENTLNDRVAYEGFVRMYTSKRNMALMRLQMLALAGELHQRLVIVKRG